MTPTLSLAKLNRYYNRQYLNRNENLTGARQSRTPGANPRFRGSSGFVQTVL